MSILKRIHTPSGKIIISIVLGFGLAAAFRASCKGRNCVIKYAAPYKDIEDKVIKQDYKCYEYILKPTKCTRDVVNYAS